MKILITGLTLHNNKGGPALALSLIKLLKKEFTTASFYLSVPNFSNNLEVEKKWAKIYAIDGVIGAIGAKELLYINPSERKVFLDALKKMNLVVDLNALSYMDLAHLTFKQNLIRNLSIYTIRNLCNSKNIPLIRWTQSYGPFSNYITKKLVLLDLKKQKNIFVRGDKSFANMNKLFNKNQIYAFPDVAISLASDFEYYKKNLKGREYITLSPSSVIYGINKSQHIKDFQKIIEHIKTLNYDIVLVPHNLMAINPTLMNCDLKICEKILEDIDRERIYLVKEDLDVYSLKGIIANAKLHIGARYHSIIASLSSAVPTIAFSWHEKYFDIMKMYKMENYVYSGEEEISQLLSFIDDLLNEKDEKTNILIEEQKQLERELDKNMELFMENYYEV